MKRLYALIVGLTIALVAACASMAADPVTTARESLAVFNRSVAQSLDRGRITSVQGAAVLVESRKARLALDSADEAFTLCGGKLPCDSMSTILARVQPMLLELERRLREEEAKKGAKP